MAIGLSLSIPVAILIGGRLIVGATGVKSPLTFIAAAVLFLPIVLTYCELAVGVPGSASAYRIARSFGSPIGAFAVGWLMLGGLIALAAVLIAEESRRLVDLLERVMDTPDSAITVTVLLVALLTAINQWLLREEQWTIRTALVWFSGLSLVALLGWIVVSQPFDLASTPEMPLISRDLAGLTLLAAGLWSLDLILNYRRLMKDPDRTTRKSALFVWGGTMLIGALSAAVVIRYPSLLFSKDLGKLGWVDPRVGVGFQIACMVLIWLGLSKVISRTVRLAGVLELHGYLPALAPGKPGSWRRQLSGLSLITLLLVLAALFLSTEYLLELAAMSYLWATAVTFLPHVRRPSRDLDSNRSNRLPLHPLIPLIGLVSCLFFSLVLPASRVLIGILWLVSGAAVFAFFGKKAKSTEPSAEETDGSEFEEGEESEFQVLIGVEDGSDAGSAIVLGAALARARQGGLILLRVVPQGGELSIEASREAAIEAGKELERLSQGYEDLAVSVRSLVRIAPSIDSGMAATARELDCGFMLLGCRHRSDSLAPTSLDFLEDVFTSTGRSAAVVFGRMPERLEKVVVATAGGPHSAEALQVGRDLAATAECPLELVHVRVRGRSDIDPNEILEQTRTKAGIETGLDARVIDADSVEAGLAQAADVESVLVLGASLDRLIGQTVLSGLSTEIASAFKGAAVVVKRTEKITRFWLRRIWRTISGPLPQLTVAERSEVYSQMRHSAKATVDFYMLISLASAIAILGLLLNSSAVIIGAMLVAPLMSPILATAQGVVQGNPYLIRRALASTIKGTATSIGVAAGITVLLPQMAPTNEILARVEPNLLDLMVAMAAGGAAAYAVSRKSVAAALPGVAISVALVPPLCVVGYGLGSAQLAIGWGALILFLTNLIGIILVGAIIFLLMGFRPTQVERGSQVRRAAIVASIGLALLVVPLGLTTIKEFREQRVRTILEGMLDRTDDERVQSRSYTVRETNGVFVIEGRIWVYDEITQEEFEQFRQRLEEATGVPVRLRATVVRATLTEVGPPSENREEGEPQQVEEGEE
ncbi:MAG: DUF389 domain-containing protein [Acidobacteriota bacterium]